MYWFEIIKICSWDGGTRGALVACLPPLPPAHKIFEGTEIEKIIEIESIYVSLCSPKFLDLPPSLYSKLLGFTSKKEMPCYEFSAL